MHTELNCKIFSEKQNQSWHAVHSAAVLETPRKQNFVFRDALVLCGMILRFFFLTRDEAIAVDDSIVSLIAADRTAQPRRASLTTASGHQFAVIEVAEQAQDFITDGVHPGRDFIGGDFLLPLPTEKDDLVAGPHGSQTGDIDQGQVH